MWPFELWLWSNCDIARYIYMSVVSVDIGYYTCNAQRNLQLRLLRHSCHIPGIIKRSHIHSSSLANGSYLIMLPYLLFIFIEPQAGA